MANAVQFSVDDTSPAISYSPFADTFGLPDLSAGWNPYFLDSGFASSIGQTGVGQSQHITSRNNASVSISWHGTSIQLFGNITSQANYTLTLDGASVQLQPNQTNTTLNLLASLDGLPNTDHSLVLTSRTPEAQDPPDSSLLVFDKAVISSPAPTSLIFTEHVLDDKDIDFSSGWTFLPSSGLPPLHESQSQGDSARATFSGISVLIFGTTSPTSGNYSVTLDGNQSPIFSARSSFTVPKSLLFFASGLDSNKSHQISVRNEGGILQLNSGGFDIFSSGEPTALPPPDNNGTPSPNTTTPSLPTNPSSALSNNKFAKGTIAALVLAGFLAFVFLTGVLFFFFIWRPRRRRQRQRERDLVFDDSHPGTRYARKSRLATQSARERDSIYPGEKDQESAGAALIGTGGVLDIGHTQRERERSQDNVDDIGIVQHTTGDTEAPLSPDIRPHRDSQKSGFARWKRDINALSGLTTLGLKFRHSDSAGTHQPDDHEHEKSPISPVDYGQYHGHRGYGDFDIDVENAASSPSGGVSGNGDRFIYGRYDPDADGGIGPEVGGVRHMSSRSSSRSFRRFGKKRQSSGKESKGKGRMSSRTGGGSGSGFPFRLSSQSRSATSHLQQHHDEGEGERESLSGFTSLSYASNPNITAEYLNVQPPSYAASVSASQQTGSNGTSSPPSVPRSVTRSPQNANTSVPPSPQDSQGPGVQTLPLPVPTQRSQSPLSLPPSPPSQPQPQPLRRLEQEQEQDPSPSPRMRSAELRTSGTHILGIGGGLGGVGGPVSMRAALRGLSPRISKARSRKGKDKKKGKGKEREEEEEVDVGEERVEQEQQQQQQGDVHQPDRESTPDHPRSDIASVGHNQPQQASGPGAVPQVPMMPSGSGSSSASGPSPRTGSPIRALPPIPIPIPAPPSSSQSQPRSQTPPQQQKDVQPKSARSLVSKEQRQRQQEGTQASGSFLDIRETSPFRLEFEPSITVSGPSPVAGAPPPDVAVPYSSSSSTQIPGTPEKRSKARSSTGDAAGLRSSGAIQSFTEAAALAATAGGSGANTMGGAGGILVEGGPSGSLGVASGEGEGDTARRLSTASRVHFEDDPTNTSGSLPALEEDQAPVRSGKGKSGKRKGKGKESEKEVKSKFRLTPLSGQSPTTPVGATGEASEFGNTSFLDFSSKPPSLHSRHTSEASGLERNPSSGNGSGDGHNRIWSMQLPGRNIAPPLPTPGGLKSKWSNTTMQTTHTDSQGSSSSNSGYGSPKHQSVGAVTSEGSPRSNIFPFPLSIPPSPYLPEGFPGVEPSPSMLSPTASIPLHNAPRRSEYGRHLRVPGAGEPPGQTSSSGHDHDPPREDPQIGSTEAPESPTDSFPYSISEVHFRTSVTSDSDSEPGQAQYARQHPMAHPPLPSSALTPQRFNPEQDEQSQQSQQSIVQRVFGGSGSGTPRTPLSGFLKPSGL